jgi:hypothetical protein
MPPSPRAIQDLDRESYRIVGMICSEAVPETEVQAAIEGLRIRTAEEFPGEPRLYDRIYGRRFARLRTRFRPAPGLFPAAR